MPPSAEKQKRLEFLDVARGVAAVLVLLEHGLHLCVPGYLQFSREYIVIGQAGVLVFFMISGFVIPMSLGQGGSVANFWIRRSFRLLPVYWLSIGLAFGYVALNGPRSLGVQLADVTTWLANLVLVQGLVRCPDIWGVFWSLHYEVALYVVCSLLFAFGLLNRIGTKTLIAALVGFTVVFSAGPLITGRPPGTGDMRLVILAALFGFMAHRYTAQQITRGTFYGLVAGLFAVVMTMWGCNHLQSPTIATPWQLLRCTTLLGLGCGAFVCLLESGNRTMPRALVWLGLRSFPIYLLHPFVLLLVTPLNLPVWAFMPCLIGTTLFLAALAHRVIEQPAIALGRKLERRRRMAVVVAPEPTVMRRAA